MSDVIAACGFLCSLCLIYRENLRKDPHNRRRFRDGLEKYYGDKLTLEECYCEGCMTHDRENPVRINKDCEVRACVTDRRIENCAYCAEYPCEKVEKKFVERSRVEEKYGSAIPEEAYRVFIMPYESRRTLDKIRQKAKRS
jgi:hypothetical protein